MANRGNIAGKAAIKPEPNEFDDHFLDVIGQSSSSIMRKD